MQIMDLAGLLLALLLALRPAAGGRQKRGRPAAVDPQALEVEAGGLALNGLFKNTSSTPWFAREVWEQRPVLFRNAAADMPGAFGTAEVLAAAKSGTFKHSFKTFFVLPR